MFSALCLLLILPDFWNDGMKVQWFKYSLFWLINCLSRVGRTFIALNEKNLVHWPLGVWVHRASSEIGFFHFPGCKFWSGCFCACTYDWGMKFEQGPGSRVPGAQNARQSVAWSACTDEMGRRHGLVWRIWNIVWGQRDLENAAIWLLWSSRGLDEGDFHAKACCTLSNCLT